MARANSEKPEIVNGLQVLGEDDDLLDFSNSAYKRNPAPNSRSTSQPSRRTPTPTKQISLTAVKRREDSFYQEDDQSTIEELRVSMKLEAERSFVKDSFEEKEYVVERNTAGSHVNKMKKPSQHNCLQNGNVETAVEKEKKQRLMLETSDKERNKGPSAKPDKKSSVGKKEESSSSDDSSDEEEEEKKAPNQLLMEFLECIYAKDYPTAAKLCKMILMYEPQHPIALQFQPVIEEKIQQDIEAEQEGSDDEDDDSGEEDDSDEDDSDSDDDSDDSDDEDDDDEEDDDEDENSANEGDEIPKSPDQPLSKKEPFKI